MLHVEHEDLVIVEQPRLSHALFPKIAYEPHEAQQEIHLSTARFKIVAAGSRFGKSMLAAIEIILLFLLPGKKIWLVATQYELAERELNWVIHFLSRLKLNGRPILSYCKTSFSAKGSKHIIAPWGSEIITRSCEKDQLLLGDEFDLLVLCEASQIPFYIWTTRLSNRLGSRDGCLLATSTPNGDGDLFNWLYDLADTTAYTQHWLFPTEANPHYSRREIERLRRELDEDVFKEQVLGQFVSRRGQVFKFSGDHCTKLMPAESTTRFVGVFYKSHNPIAIVYIAPIFEENITKYLVYDEDFLINTTVREAAPIIRDKLSGRNVGGVFADYWDSAVQKELAAAGNLVTSCAAEKHLGKNIGTVRRIQHLMNYMKPLPELGPRLLVNVANCPNLIEHLQKCRWPEKRRGNDDRLEHELPPNKFLALPLAVSYVTAFCSDAQGERPFG